jgi:ribosomal protein S18 acetylase RimI-like enzyme
VSNDWQARSAAALRIWRDARAAEGRQPTPERLRRVAEKLADPAGFLIVEQRSDDVVGMALAEAFRTAGGQGDARPGWGHVSMVFVQPEAQGSGVGGNLMRRLISEVPWSCLSLWTREANSRAQALYRRCGFVATSELGSTPWGDLTRRWERC